MAFEKGGGKAPPPLSTTHPQPICDSWGCFPGSAWRWGSGCTEDLEAPRDPQLTCMLAGSRAWELTVAGSATHVAFLQREHHTWLSPLGTSAFSVVPRLGKVELNPEDS